MRLPGDLTIKNILLAIILFGTLFEGNQSVCQEANLHCLEQYWYLDGEYDEQDFGFKVAGDIDVNLDSYGDILVVSGSWDPQIVEVFLGSDAGWSHENKIRLKYDIGPDSSWLSTLGGSFSVEGDINGDGNPDLVLGDMVNNKVYIYYSSTTFSGDYDFQFSTGNYAYGESPERLSSNIDFNNDGYQDIVVSASINHEMQVFYGGLILDDSVDIVVPFPSEFGSLTLAEPKAFVSGDFNADGYSDLANSYTYYPEEYHSLGLVVVSFGDETGFNYTTDWYYVGIDPDSLVGASLQVDDFNQDGIDDLLAGAARNALVFFGGIEFDTIPDFHFTRNGPYHDEMRFELLRTDIDINGDGFHDYISASPGYGQGMLFFTLGGPGNDGKHECTLLFPDDFAYRFGRSFSPVGDVNGDGIDDIIVGDGRDDPWPNPPRGRISIYLGNSELVGTDKTKPMLPKKLQLEVYPNPFNPSTTILYELPETSNLTITIYDIQGRDIWSYKESSRSAGHYSLKWNGLNYNGKQSASGIYLISLSTPKFRAAKKAILIR